MDKIYTLAEVAEMLSVNKETLRIWDRKGILRSIKTPGGHRRYTQLEIDRYMGKSNLGNLYEHLCSAQYMADEMKLEEAPEIMNIRERIGQKLLKEHMERIKGE